MILHNLSCEEVVIGSILIEGTRLFEEARNILYPEDFYDSDCKMAFKVFINLYAKKIPIDIVFVSKYYIEKKIAKILFLKQAMDSVPTTANFHYYIKVVKDYAYKREIFKKVESFRIDKIDTEKLVQEICTIPKYEEIKEKTNKEIILETIEDANRGMDFEFPEEFRSINGVIGGIDRGNLIVIGGYPSNGKSSLMISLVFGFTNQLEYKVLITTLEMNPKEIMRRLEARACTINTMKFRTKSLTNNDKESIKSLIPHINDIWKYNCVRVYTIADIVRAINKYEPDILFIDYLQNISGDDDLSLYAKRTKHTLEIQRLTKEKNIVTFLLSQFHRSQEGKVRRPHNNDFRDSGAIEERADIIFLIYWERKLKMESLLRRDGDDPEFMELNITKSKDGATGSLPYNFYPEYHRWIDPRDEDREVIMYRKAKEVSEIERRDIDG
jgi:replicative DNA helicase